MKPPMRAIVSCFFFMLFSVTPIFMLGLHAKEPPKKVAILPFTMHAQQEMDYLRDGIVDMLTTRLYWKDKVTVIEKGVVRKAMADHPGAMDSEYAEQLGKELGADYVLFGSVTVFGESVSLDATILSTARNVEPVTVFTQTKGMASVIPEINGFAQKINGQIFGRPEALAQVRRRPSLSPSGPVTDSRPKAPRPPP